MAMAKETILNKYLVIVESPSKAKTIQKYLGKEYIVKASVGHIKDLPKSKLGVDPEKKFATDYQVLPAKVKVVEDLKKAAKDITELYLATDPDREGEAIAWHIKEELSSGSKKKKIFHRVLFNSITKASVQEAIAHPVTLSLEKYQAQQSRRILDRLVGYKISPLLWRKVKWGISAGRVQSVSLKIIVDREKAIQEFVSQEYWSIDGIFQAQNPTQQPLALKLFKVDKKDFQLGNQQQVDSFLASLEKTAWHVSKIEKKERQRKPQAPFITSRLQQDAATKLGFSAKKTMILAQKLYEGVNLGEFGTHGLITYMRTDSVRTDPAAIASVRDWIALRFGKNYLPESPYLYQSKKSAQDAHEAIRPASLDFSPDQIQGFLDRDEMALYQLIWNRFVASQMAPTVLDQITLEVEGENSEKQQVTFRTTLSAVKFAGFTQVYKDYLDDVGSGSVLEKMPDWKEMQRLNCTQLKPEQHFTAPPPRFNDASLIKDLEEKGIGRPSTYATILSNLQDREYIEKRENRFFPSELGLVVSDLLAQSFPDIVNEEFTANMETQLDEIEEGKKNWIAILKAFWKTFDATLKLAAVHMKDLKQQVVETKIACEACGDLMVIKWGKAGSFLSCRAYPECKSTQDFKKDEAGEIQIIPKQYSDKKCVQCGHLMLLKEGKFGRFLACSQYPDCKSTQPYAIGVNCPECKIGEIAQRQSLRFKRIFYSCMRYPDCTFAVWDLPIAKPCGVCHYPITIDKVTKRQGHIRKCSQKGCSFVEFLDSI
jgi:DNA topoisomerase-1